MLLQQVLEIPEEDEYYREKRGPICIQNSTGTHALGKFSFQLLYNTESEGYGAMSMGQLLAELAETHVDNKGNDANSQIFINGEDYLYLEHLGPQVLFQ